MLAQVALRLAAHRVSIARLIQHQDNGSATLHVVTHEGAEGDLRSALREIESLPETTGPPSALPVISDRGVAELGWSCVARPVGSAA